MTSSHRLFATIVTAVCILLVLGVDDARAEEDYGYVEFAVGVNLNGPWIGDYPSHFEGGYVWNDVVKKNLYVRAYLNHSSNIERGSPRNDKAETYIDKAGVAIGWRF